MERWDLTREAEEQHLSEIISVVQNALDQGRVEIRELSEETERLMKEANKTGDKGILTLWNTSKAMLEQKEKWLIRDGKARKKPYFGRIDFKDLTESREESFYIGRVGINKTPTEPLVIDWRAPLASLYYENGIGKGTYQAAADQQYEVDLKRKRTYEIEEDKLVDFYDLDVVSNDELLTKYLSKNKSEVLGEIIATIQQEQNQIIRRSPKTNVIVQGVAGSGKTTVAMHRISYILYNYEEDFRPEDFYIIGSNQILLNYITGVLPELDVQGARQMTMDQLFIRLLYEDWDAKKFSVHPFAMQKGNERKGTGVWFQELEAFCRNYEREEIKTEAIYLEKAKVLLLSGEQIREYLDTHPLLSMQSKKLMLNEILYAKYENFISGRNASFTEEERKEADRYFSTYFAKWGKYGKSQWNGSIFELYQRFLDEQEEKGFHVDRKEDSFDVYDLAALAYLYKRIKETDPIREATHVVIDEAQDFGMMAYHVLCYCMRGCTYTIMGDTSQNIHYQYGLNDWNELKKLLLTGVRDSFCILKKSYRNTVEISDFATEILRHGDFSIYPVQPVLRHGKPVQIQELGSTIRLTNQAVKTIQGWQESGLETIAVICRDEEEVKKVSARLKKKIDIKEMEGEKAEFGSGVMVLPVAHTKGLEFDAVLLWDPTKDKYPEDNGHVKMLYVAATRALHEMAVLYCSHLSTLVSDKVPREKHLEEFQPDKDRETEEFLQKPVVVTMEQKKRDALKEQEERSYLGPKKIRISSESTIHQVEGIGQKQGTISKRTTADQEEISRGTGKDAEKTVAREKNRDYKVNPSAYVFGEMPQISSLTVRGHVKPNLSVKWIKKSKQEVELTSSYGILTIQPVTEEVFRIRFTKGNTHPDERTDDMISPVKGLKWTARESSTTVEIATAKLVVRIEKRDGAIRFMTPDRKKILLQEKTSGARILEGAESWNFFEFERSEKLRAKGPLKEELLDLTGKARYISYGGRRWRMPLLLSKKGYALALAADETAMFCGISTYGQYLYTDKTGTIDYFFLYGKNEERNLQLYQKCLLPEGK